MKSLKMSFIKTFSNTNISILIFFLKCSKKSADRDVLNIWISNLKFFLVITKYINRKELENKLNVKHEFS